jgi:hypothetical protein
MEGSEMRIDEMITENASGEELVAVCQIIEKHIEVLLRGRPSKNAAFYAVVLELLIGVIMRNGNPKKHAAIASKFLCEDVNKELVARKKIAKSH